MADTDKDTQPFEPVEETGGAVSGDVLHGGEDDPLGGGVAELDEEEDVSEGVPRQDG